MLRRMWWLALVVGACDDGGTTVSARDRGPIDPDGEFIARPETGPIDPFPDGGLDLDAAVSDGPVAPDPDAAPRDRSPRVAVDLTPFLEGGGAGAASVRRIERADELIGGPAAQGRVGDYLFENDRVRLIVEHADRYSAVCPYGGNIIDGDVRRECAGPECGEDVVGEVCLMLMLSQTLSPDRFEVLASGADGGAAVLAVSGGPQLLDFINLRGIVGGFLPGVELGFDTETLLPVRITIYYILRPGDAGARVVAAVRNDGDEIIHMPVSHVIDSGGAVDFFSPLGPFGGFGYDNLGPSTLAGTPLTFLSFQGERAGYTLAPKPRPGLPERAYPTSGVYVTVSGVAVTAFDTANIAAALLARPPQFPGLSSLTHLEPGATATYEHWHLISDASLSNALDPAWAVLGVATTPVSGRVLMADEPVAGVRVSVLDGEGRTLNQSVTGPDGAFALQSPRGAMTLRAWHPGRPAVAQALEVGEAPVEATLAMAAPGALRVTITRPDGTPTPGKVLVSCDGECPDGLSPNDRDATFDAIPTKPGRLHFAGMDGVVELPLPAGRYEVSVTRGLEWSVWPPDAVANGAGAPIDVVAGETTEVTAEIAHVVDSSGAISGDFHVHAINSPDAPVENAERVRTFLGEGVDVLVSTDHDFITDYAPVIAALGAEDEVVNVIGEEITTFDYGHFNAFPLTPDPAVRNGGALDWSGAEGPGLAPDEIMGWVHAQPGAAHVAMANHSASSFGVWQVDFLTGESFADPELFRIGGLQADPVTGDTGLFTERFTAMELMNDAGVGDFWGLTRWWLTMVGRGLVRTGTAVSDTHKRAKTQAGEARSFVFTPGDTPRTLDRDAFAAAVNAGRLLGTNGPFFRVVARAGEATAGPGDTLALVPGEPARLTVTIDVPEWMPIDTLDLFVNLPADQLVDAPGTLNRDELQPTRRIPITLSDDQLQVVAEGTQVHRHRVIEIEAEVEAAVDSYVVVMIRSREEGGRPIYPVSLSRGVRPLGFMNPIFLDADGGGYDHPPLAGLAQKRARRPRAAAPKRPLDRAGLIELLEKTEHRH